MHEGIGKVFISGDSQAVRLPCEFHLDTDEVYVHRAGDSLVLTPRARTWDGFAEGLSGFSDDFRIDGGLEADTARRSFG